MEPSLDTSVAGQSHEEFQDCMGKETRIAFDEPVPGELGVIVPFALLLVLVIGLLLE